jgi:hypothetical protein
MGDGKSCQGKGKLRVDARSELDVGDEELSPGELGSRSFWGLTMTKASYRVTVRLRYKRGVIWMRRSYDHMLIAWLTMSVHEEA